MSEGDLSAESFELGDVAGGGGGGGGNHTRRMSTKWYARVPATPSHVIGGDEEDDE